MFEEPNYVSKRNISADAIHLIQSLLDKNPKKRLTPEKIPDHPFFRKTNFDDIETMKTIPPFKPRVMGLDDLSNIDPTFLREDVISPMKNQKIIINPIEQSNMN
jgi:serine/threonine protein kinase